jgi:5-oxoprolinase (ATP-hydrolysing)
MLFFLLNILLGNQARPAIFDLEIKKPELLYECVVEVNERVRLAAKTPDGSEADNYPKVKGVTGEYVEIIQEPDLEKLKADLKVSSIPPAAFCISRK